MSRRHALIRRWFSYLFILVSLFVFAYPVGRLTYWYSAAPVLAWASATFVWIVAILASRYVFSGPKMKSRYFVVHWMGVSFILACWTLIADLLNLVTDMSNISLAHMVVSLTVVAIVIAVVFSHHLAVKQFTVSSAKVDRRYRIAQISDVHIGSRQKGFMARIVKKLNAARPDIVVITGDLIDSSAVDLEALESIREISVTTLFSIGNHERYADLPKVLDMAERLGMTTLRQQTWHSGQLAITGIDDADDPDHVALNMIALPQDPAKFNILMYHRPVGWEAAIDHGIDLMLSGHTHNGQIFPFNLLVKQQFKRIAGLYIENDARLYVSSGTGTWGPLMRLGSMNEITLFDLLPDRE
jgi:predicted MPP superfamily phosphohydrolase